MFQLLFERSTDPIWLFDPKSGVFVDCNPAAVKLLGYHGKNELLLARPEDLSPPMQPDGRSSKEAAIELAERVEREGGLRFEWLARRATGEEVPLEVVATPITSNGRTLQVIVSRDISERKRADEELRASQQLLASVVDNITEGVYRTGPAHELIFANRAYLKLSGYDSLEELQRVPRETLYANPADRARLIDLLARTGEFRNEEIRYVNRQGELWWGLSNSIAIRDPATGAVLYHIGSVKDVSRRLKAQEELLTLNATLERRVTERTAELAASEARLRTLLEHAPEAIVVFDAATGRFLSGNAHASRIYGRRAGELTQLTPAEVSPEFQPDGRRSVDVAREKMNEALAGGAPVFEWIHRHSSGRLIPTEVRLVRLPAEGQDLLRASIIDNTERKRREKIQKATFQISEAVHTADDLDSLYRQIHGIVSGLMPARNFYISLHDAQSKLLHFPYFVDEQDACQGPLEEGRGLTGYVLRTGRTLLAARKNMVHKTDGRGIIYDGQNEVPYVECGTPPLQWLGAPMLIRGRPMGVLEVFDYQDDNAYGDEEKQLLTFIAGQTALAIERKRAEHALRESEEKFRALFEASSAGVMLHDEHSYLEVNPATLRILGYERAEQLIGKNPGLTSPPLQPDGGSSALLASQHIHECLTKGSARFDWVARTAAGDDLPLEVILTRIEWGGRKIIQAVITDISERKKAEAELLKALAREKELSALKSSFVSMVSHEFRTPLGIIMSSAEILEDYFEQLVPEDRKIHLESIRKNTRRMADLMEEVLVLSRFDAGKMDFKPAPLDIPVFCQRLADELLSATNRQCPIHLSIPDSGLAQTKADERLLSHIFTNLLANAIKYSSPGSPVHFEVQRHGQELVCRVQDRGIGIPEADQQWLFKAFHRGRNVGQRPGSGLGLVIVKRCVELHGGTIGVESRLGHGTDITVRLPFVGES
jgi:PAS domain S-box-containing protein